MSRFNFNTSHVVVYPSALAQSKNPLESFQYISCCSLSQVAKLLDGKLHEFQYISCCSLSGTILSPNKIIDISIHLML